MEIERIGIDASVDAIFPPGPLREALSDLDVDLAIVDGSRGIPEDLDAVVTFDHYDGLVETVEWVHSIQAGYDHFPLDAYEAAEVVLTSSVGIHGAPVGETVAGYLLMLARRLHVYVAHQQHHEWYSPDWDAAFTLADEPLCVVGLGTIGRGIARRADALGMRVTGVRRTPEPVPGVERVYPADDLHDAIADARFVALAVPLTDETEGLLDAAALDRMREDAYLVNVARGPVVDEAALIDAIRDGDIAGAALDVFEEEPLPADSPLWDLDDVIVTPHRSSLNVNYYEDVAGIVRENLRAARAGGSWTNPVTGPF